MVIEDDGVGSTLRRRPGRRSFGLTAMRERVEVLGGRIHLRVQDRESGGQSPRTRIEVDLRFSGRTGVTRAMRKKITVLICDDHAMFREA